MAVLDQNRSVSDISIFAGHFGRVVASTVAAIVDWNNARLTRNTLAALTDRELDDIGLTRGDVDLVASVQRLKR